MERRTISEIREAVRTRKIPLQFKAAQVNACLGINYVGTFLPKHRVGNPGNYTELFIRIEEGLYQLKPNNGDK